MLDKIKDKISQTIKETKIQLELEYNTIYIYRSGKWNTGIPNFTKPKVSDMNEDKKSR